MQSIFEFLRLAEKLKCEKRDNRLSNGGYESVAAHSWMMGLFALLFADKMKTPVDLGHVLKIVLVHDLAEALAGDLSLAKQNSAAAVASKNQKEKAAIETIVAPLSADKKAEILSLWQEYEDMRTDAAKFAKACDKLEAIVQALLYKNVGYWREEADGDFYYDDVLNRRREKYWRNEPAFCEFFELLRTMAADRMLDEGIRL